MIRDMTARIGLWLILMSLPFSAFAKLSVLTYHDVLPDASKDKFAVSKSRFVEHMDYLEKNGYRVLSLTDLQTHYKEHRKLPHKAVLLTFDDGLKSYAEFVVPVLRSYAFPSVASVVTAWLDGKEVPREYTGKLMDWKTLKSVAKQPLVDVISHTNNMHHGVASNPQGNEAPAAVTRQYFPETGEYETEDRFRERVTADFKQSVGRIQAELGGSPQGIAWPYGSYDKVVSREASLMGLTFQFNLDIGPNDVDDLPMVRRIMLVGNPTVQDLANELAYHYPDRGRKGLVYLNLDDFAGLNQQQSEELLGRLLDVLDQAKIKSVVINPLHQFTRKAFFYTKAMPMESDVLNRITHQIRNRLGIREIILDMPSIAENNRQYNQVYEDLARLVWFSGIVLREKDMQSNDALFKRMSDFHPLLKRGYGGQKQLAEAKPGTFVMQFADSGKSQQDMNRFADRVQNMAANVYLIYRLQDGNSKVAKSIEKLRILGISRVGVGAGVNAYIRYQKQYLTMTTIDAIKKWALGESV